MPRVSVIVPVYQAEKYLRKCVESVRKQTFPDWELLLIDDGSPDDSGAICDACAAEDSRIRVIHRKKNGGVSAARNDGLTAAKGEYLAFLDVDDRYEYRMLEKMLEELDRTGADSAACAHLNLWADGTKQPELCLPAGVYEGEELREKIVYPLLGDRLKQPVFNGFIWRYVYSSDVLRRNHITFQGAYLEDELFLMEYFCCAKKLAVTEEPLYRYFHNPSSATHKYMADFLQVFRRHMARKESLSKKYDLTSHRPQWRENSNWAGLLILVSNEYALGNDLPLRKKQRKVENYVALPEMAKAIAEYQPEGLSPHKQMVAKLLKGKHYFTLTQMYRLKNRI